MSDEGGIPHVWLVAADGAVDAPAHRGRRSRPRSGLAAGRQRHPVHEDTQRAARHLESPAPGGRGHVARRRRRRPVGLTRRPPPRLRPGVRDVGRTARLRRPAQRPRQGRAADDGRRRALGTSPPGLVAGRADAVLPRAPCPVDRVAGRGNGQASDARQRVRQAPCLVVRREVRLLHVGTGGYRRAVEGRHQQPLPQTDDAGQRARERCQHQPGRHDAGLLDEPRGLQRRRPRHRVGRRAAIRNPPDGTDATVLKGRILGDLRLGPRRWPR